MTVGRWRAGARAPRSRGLPLHVYEAEGEQEVKPCAEVQLTEREIDRILDRGYMALACDPRPGRGAADTISIDREASGWLIGPVGIKKNKRSDLKCACCTEKMEQEFAAK